jgi:NAD(P)-dependent dehydrogenase (short-subunit alcohol dehydrogenase family)
VVTYDFSGLGFDTGDVVVVTGAASGIGRATALMAARSGLTVVGWDLDEGKLARIRDEITTAGGTAHCIVCDVTDTEQIAAAWRTTGALGDPAYLVNNAGPPSGTPLSIADGLVQGAASMAEVTDTWLSQFGNIASATTFTASISGNYVSPQAGRTWYPMAKAAIAAYARHLAVSRRGRPRANVVAPGLTATPRTEALLTTAAGQAMARAIPSGRIGTADDQAAAIMFLLSPAASHINGVTIPVDGGSILAGG